MTNTLSNISVIQLKRAVAIREQIEVLQAEMASILDGTPATPAPVATEEPAVPGKRRTMSAAARAKIAAAQKLRWAKVRTPDSAAAPTAADEPAVPGKRRTMSPAARAKIAAAQKLRWAKVKKTAAPVAEVSAKPARKMSAAARARISAATKARWARVHAANRKSL